MFEFVYQDSPFIYQITADAVNLRQTAHIIFHLSRYNEPFADMIVTLLLSAAQKLPLEQSQPFFKLLSFLTDVGENGLPGLPSFTGMILPKIWQVSFLMNLFTLYYCTLYFVLLCYFGCLHIGNTHKERRKKSSFLLILAYRLVDTKLKTC